MSWPLLLVVLCAVAINVRWLALAAGLLSILFFLGLHCYVYLRPTQQLKVKYSATWAIVTGASSGIGRSLAFALAQQGLNVVLLALPDTALTDTLTALSATFPAQRFITVGVDLSNPDGSYMEAVEEATTGIPVQLVFCNAGYCNIEVFVSSTQQAAAHNVQVNLISAMRLSNHFATRMVAQGLEGALVFTSSMSAHIPGPTSAVYAATKAALTAFGAALAVELAALGIDVTVVHPGPTRTRFFDTPKPLQVLQQMRRIAMPPDSLPGVIFRAMGRVTLLDVGVVSIAAHLLAKVVDANLLVWLMKLTGGGPDLRRMQQEARQQQQQQPQSQQPQPQPQPQSQQQIASDVISKLD